MNDETKNEAAAPAGAQEKPREWTPEQLQALKGKKVRAWSEESRINEALVRGADEHCQVALIPKDDLSVVFIMVPPWQIEPLPDAQQDPPPALGQVWKRAVEIDGDNVFVLVKRRGWYVAETLEGSRFWNGTWTRIEDAVAGLVYAAENVEAWEKIHRKENRDRVVESFDLSEPPAEWLGPGEEFVFGCPGPLLIRGADGKTRSAGPHSELEGEGPEISDLLNAIYHTVRALEDNGRLDDSTRGGERLLGLIRLTLSEGLVNCDQIHCCECGCIEAVACEGGCFWATLDPPRCSRCETEVESVSPSTDKPMPALRLYWEVSSTAGLYHAKPPFVPKPEIPGIHLIVHAGGENLSSPDPYRWYFKARANMPVYTWYPPELTRGYDRPADAMAAAEEWLRGVYRELFEKLFGASGRVGPPVLDLAAIIEADEASERIPSPRRWLRLHGTGVAGRPMLVEVSSITSLSRALKDNNYGERTLLEIAGTDYSVHVKETPEAILRALGDEIVEVEP